MSAAPVMRLMPALRRETAFARRTTRGTPALGAAYAMLCSEVLLPTVSECDCA